MAENGIDIHHVDMEMIGGKSRPRCKQPDHHDVVHFIADLERDIYGEVVSDSIKDHVAGCWYDPALISGRY